jgi:hypothetical protein
MQRKGTEVVVDALPPCDWDATHGPASYDFKSTSGPWGYGCDACFKERGMGLGLGIGQKLILRASTAGEAVER